MNGTLAPFYRLLPAIAIALGCCLASGGEVTVIGSATIQYPPRPGVVDRAAYDAPALANRIVQTDVNEEDAPRPIVFPRDSFFDVPPMAPPPETEAGSALESPTQQAIEPETAPLFDWSRLLSFAVEPLEASCYTRFDYFQWNERHDGIELLEEHGTLFTLGYRRSRKAQLLRGEFFAGNMHYCGTTWGGDPVDAVTRYIGVRAEYEWHWNVNFRGRPAAVFFGGIGNRFWIRDIQDGIIWTTGDFSTGYQEIWWTLYPYMGLERKRILPDGMEMFVSGRVGLTACTSEKISVPHTPTLHPNPGFTGQVECGIRLDKFFGSVYFEAMGWRMSPVKDYAYQPFSQMYTTGIKVGLVY